MTLIMSYIRRSGKQAVSVCVFKCVFGVPTTRVCVSHLNFNAYVMPIHERCRPHCSRL